MLFCYWVLQGVSAGTVRWRQAALLAGLEAGVPAQAAGAAHVRRTQGVGRAMRRWLRAEGGCHEAAKGHGDFLEMGSNHAVTFVTWFTECSTGFKRTVKITTDLTCIFNVV